MTRHDAPMTLGDMRAQRDGMAGSCSDAGGPAAPGLHPLRHRRRRRAAEPARAER